jgi:hypothetical protein
MTHTLRILMQTLINADDAADTLTLADTYLAQMETMGDEFVLPRDHVTVKPILEYYYSDLPGFIRFVKRVRDGMAPKSAPKMHVHEVYRRLDVRLTQQERRVRLDLAADIAIKKELIPDDYHARLSYNDRCTEVWGKRKENLLRVVRAETPKKRISIDHREKLLTDFWNTIRQELDNGEVPPA